MAPYFLGGIQALGETSTRKELQRSRVSMSMWLHDVTRFKAQGEGAFSVSACIRARGPTVQGPGRPGTT